jgi:hypothetical protein
MVSQIEHPRGASIARLLQSQLESKGWKGGELENWRDCGWSFLCSKGNTQLEVAVSGLQDASEWMLQIAPVLTPGFWGRLLGQTPSATPNDCFAVAKEVHGTLRTNNSFSRFMWRQDGFPDERNSTPEPAKPK